MSTIVHLAEHILLFADRVENAEDDIRSKASRLISVSFFQRIFESPPTDRIRTDTRTNISHEQLAAHFGPQDGIIPLLHKVEQISSSSTP